ncbi:MAG: MFS family permease [Maribacter sp.]|jgi:MFS family permease
MVGLSTPLLKSKQPDDLLHSILQNNLHSQLTHVYHKTTFSFIDRNILTFMVEPMKRDMGLSDPEMSLFLGASFGLFYSFLGIPLGRLADIYSRKKIISVGIALWSIMTAIYALIPFGFMVSTSVGTAAAAVQEIMPNRMRGIASSILILSNNLLGLTIGPTGVALMTDYVFKDEMALAWSLLIISISSLSVAAILF